jgi:hypothetical protein
MIGAEYKLLDPHYTVFSISLLLPPFVEMFSSGSQNYWVSGLCPLSGIINTRRHCFENWICFHSQVRGGDTYSVGSLRKRKPQSLDI